MTRDVVLPEHSPGGLHDQQYSRAATYLSHAAFVENFLRTRDCQALKIIEFGGSNGFVRSLFDCPGYEIADNLPAVDIHDLSEYQPSTFDCVVLDEILEHVERPWDAVDELHRILRPGGCLMTSSPFMIAEHKMPKDYWRFTKDGLEILLRRFRDVETHSWGNPSSVTYLMKGMMVTVRDAIDADEFDLTNVEKYAISVWAYAWK